MNKQEYGKAKQLFSLAKYQEAIDILTPHVNEINEEVLDLLIHSHQQLLQFDLCLKYIHLYEETHAIEAKPRWLSYKTVALNGLGRAEEAKIILEDAVKRYPNFVDFHHNLSVIYANQANWQEALGFGETALKLVPNSFEILSQVGRVLISLRNSTKSKEIFKRLIKLAPKRPDGYNGMGAAYLLEFNVPKSIEWFEKALSISPNHGTTLGNLGVAYKTIGEHQKAKDIFTKAIQYEPNNIEHTWNLSLLELLMGDLLNGWKHYESRYNPARTVIDRVVKPAINIPMLEGGTNVAGKTVCMVVEQGYGDNIQFARYAKNLRQQGAQVVIITPKPLMSLMQTLPWANFVCDRWSACPALDYWVYPMSMPSLCGTTIDNIPREIPYLFAQDDLVKKWADFLGPRKKKLRVGLVWAGRPGHGNDKNRSMILDDFAPLAHPDVEFIGLQTGERAKDPIPQGMDLLNLGDQINNFAESASLLSQLDLVISIDSAPAHLAGALGCPVWVLLPSNPDFRWMLDRKDSPWYDKSMELFRQEKQGSWASAIELIRLALEERLKNPAQRSVLALPSFSLNPEGLNEAGAMPLMRLAIDAQNQGNGQYAAQIYQFVLRYSPWEIDAWRNWAVHLRRTGQVEQAKKCYEECFKLNPDDKHGHANYANLLADLQEMDLAEKHAKRALELDPSLHNAWYILSTVYQSRGEQENTLAAIDKALEIDPHNVVYLTMKGLSYLRTKDLVKSRAFFDQARAFNSAHPEMLIGSAQLLTEEGRFEESLNEHDRLIQHPEIIPVNLKSEVLTSRAALQTRIGNFLGAVDDVRSAIELEPENADAHFNLGLYLLMTGNLEQGWPEYEWRYHPKRKSADRVQLPDFYNQSLHGPLWQSEPLAGKSIAIITEQGFGDNIQFIRYARLIKELGATVSLICHEALHDLMLSCPGIDGVYSRISQIPSTDYWALPLSLPHCLHTRLETIPAPDSYLHSPQPYQEKWVAKLTQSGLLAKPLVILVHKGSSKHGNDKNRSVDLGLFAPLVEQNPQIHFALMDQSAKDQAQVPCGNANLVNLGVEVENFSDMAAIFSYASLIISVDSAPLHLAGAIGKEAWALIPFVPDWRWMLEREDTPWYPKTQLFRQKAIGDWIPVVTQINEVLRVKYPLY